MLQFVGGGARSMNLMKQLNRARVFRTFISFGLPLLALGCSKADEVAKTTPAQNAAMTNLDVIAKASTKKPEPGRVPPPAR